MTQATALLQVDARRIHEDPPVTQLTLEGRFDAEGLPMVLGAIDEARREGSSRFVVDLEKVSFIGSAGIGIFLSLVEEMGNDGGGVVFSRVPESIRRIFEVLNVLEFLEIRDEQSEALELLT